MLDSRRALSRGGDQRTAFLPAGTGASEGERLLEGNDVEHVDLARDGAEASAQLAERLPRPQALGERDAQPDIVGAVGDAVVVERLGAQPREDLGKARDRRVFELVPVA